MNENESPLAFDPLLSEIVPPEVPSEPVAVEEVTAEVPSEGAAFNAGEFARRWKDVWSGDVGRLERLGGRQKMVVEGAGEAWLRALLKEVPAKTVWGFLNPKPKEGFAVQRVELRQLALRGFQPVQGALRKPMVGNRLVAWLDKHRDGAHVLLLLWGDGAADVVRELDEEADDAALLGAVRTFGAAAWWGAAFLGSQSLFERIEGVLAQPELLVVEETVDVVTPDGGEVSEMEGESEDGGFWRERAEGFKAELEVKGRELRMVQEENGELGVLRERLRASQREVDKVHKEEKQRETAWQKKLELAQKAAQAQLGEVKKHDERESRRLHAAEKTRDELDSTVKVLRKQVRHLNQLLDEQQKKIAALEARLAESAAKDGDSQAVDAVSTPLTTQKSADQPVKVARPTPLDELFRWMADGHEFRATPRETMRCIDRGDADFAFRAQLALEGIAERDIAKKNAFLTRLREQDGYYVRVLTEPTQRALVDASNVVRSTKNRYGKGELRNLLGMKVELRRLGFFPIEMIADASLRHHVDEINAYNEMVNRGEVEVVTPGMEADEVLVRKVRSGGGYVVTNDGKFYFKVSPDMAPPSISFRVYAGTVIVDDF